jgi:hypothetical protein
VIETVKKKNHLILGFLPFRIFWFHNFLRARD